MEEIIISAGGVKESMVKGVGETGLEADRRMLISLPSVPPLPPNPGAMVPLRHSQR